MSDINKSKLAEIASGDARTGEQQLAASQIVVLLEINESLKNIVQCLRVIERQWIVVGERVE